VGLLGGCGASSVTDVTLETPRLGKDPSKIETSLLAVPAKNGIKKTKTNKNELVRKAAEKLSSVGNPRTVAYKIGPLDVLEISVFKVSDLSKVVQVSDAGTVNVPLIGEITAGGRTAREVEKELTKKWGAKYLQNPQVTVFVKEFNSQRVTVEGAVKKPGVFPIQGRMTLLQAIATAQGLNDNSDSTVIVFREQQGKRAAARFDVAQIRNGKADDPKLQAGDVIVAGKSAMKETFNNFIKALPIASVFALL